MKKIELEELKQIELNMMQEINKVCQDNGIHYYMVGGTLLGAVVIRVLFHGMMISI